ncbi:MAG: hypothetical protein QOK37_3244 [Thermoanaerobaculia bacterium]|jgi:hypothetical protein|nr:hypothetical protein [Thermoanaerobaculia bacterium]
MSDSRGSGVGGRGSDNKSGSIDFSPTPDSRQATPAEPNWPLLYSAVLAELVILIILFYTFTKAFA